jgi:hypothetical protein
MHRGWGFSVRGGAAPNPPLPAPLAQLESEMHVTGARSYMHAAALTLLTLPCPHPWPSSRARCT